MIKYLNLSIGARRRLDILRRDAEKLNAGYNARKAANNPEPYTWRDVRYGTFRSRCNGLDGGRNGDRHIWYTFSGDQFTRERYADEIIRIGHQGWYTDEDARETARGLVVALPHGRFLAGYHWTDNDERVYFSEIYTDQDDAARAADREAERFAEVAREDDRKSREARNLEDDIEVNLRRLRECLALRNNKCFAHLRDEARQAIESIRDSRRTLETEYANYI